MFVLDRRNVKRYLTSTYFVVWETWTTWPKIKFRLRSRWLFIRWTDVHDEYYAHHACTNIPHAIGDDGRLRILPAHSDTFPSASQPHVVDHVVVVMSVWTAHASSDRSLRKTRCRPYVHGSAVGTNRPFVSFVIFVFFFSARLSRPIVVDNDVSVVWSTCRKTQKKN